MKVRVTCTYRRLIYRCQLSNAHGPRSEMRMARLWRVLELLIDGRFVEAGHLLTGYQPTLHPVDGELELLGVITREAGRYQQLRIRCSLGHTNPAGSVFCDQCGESLIGN
jgi:hypothetical protein